MRDLPAVWRAAAAIDPTLAGWPAALPALASRQLVPISYSRLRLFTAMVQQRPVVFSNHPVTVPMRRFFESPKNPTRAIKGLFSPSATTLTKLGTAQRRRHLRVHDVADRWWTTDDVMSANDIHFRALGLDRRFNCSTLSDFNILPNSPAALRHLEVATMLLGTRGAMSDSHSDDPDGCNHCITGTKLWLVWDRLEGQRLGLQDTEYDVVYSRARFNLTAFLRARSAAWFIVSTGRTLFLPGHLTHKVITLEKYFGISSFYVGLANALSSLSRWKIRGAVMVTEDQARDIADLICERLRVACAADRSTKQTWGFYHVPAALRQWQRQHTAAEKRMVLSEPKVRQVVDIAASLS